MKQTTASKCTVINGRGCNWWTRKHNKKKWCAI